MGWVKAKGIKHYSARLESIAAILQSNPSFSRGRSDALGLVDGKCGLSLSTAIREHWNAFTPAQQRELRRLYLQPVFSHSRIIGYFQINYDDTGTHAPALLDSTGSRIPNTVEAYVDSVGKYFNMAWNIEVDSMHYPAPPFQSGQNHYVVNIFEEGTGFYGQTTEDDQLSTGVPALYSTHIEIDNDFQGFYSPGMSGLAVTAAHEFHHAIQLGRYGEWGLAGHYFYEITSVWMEGVLHPAIKDYYQYVMDGEGFPRGQFLHPDWTFSARGAAFDDIEYSRGIWGKFIEKQYSRDAMLRTWENMKTMTVLPSINLALQSEGSSLQKAFAQWSAWNYYTGRRADSLRYYPDAAAYPLITERDTVFYFSPTGNFVDSVQGLSSAYHPILVNGGTKIFSIITNVDFGGNLFEQHAFQYRMSDNTDGTFSRLDSLLYVKLDVPDAQNWRTFESIPAIPPPPAAKTEVVVYPNPYNPPYPYAACTDCLTFKLPPEASSYAHLFVFSSGYKKLFDDDLPINTGDFSIAWHGVMTNGDKLPSGIYFYFIAVGNQEYSGKFAVVKKGK